VTWSPTVDPEWLQLASLDLLQEAGARLLLHSWMSTALVEDGNVRGVVFESKQGRRAILAKVVVDASGDLDVLARAGAPFESDIDSGDVNHCINTAWTWTGVDMGAGSRSCWSGRTISKLMKRSGRSGTSSRRWPRGATRSRSSSAHACPATAVDVETSPRSSSSRGGAWSRT
jgi:hypothetical protein